MKINLKRPHLLLPGWLRAVVRYIKVLEIDYNHFQSAYQRKCIDRTGMPIPWYTYPAIEYLKQLDFSQKTVFEYGGGSSTLFWASRSRKVVCVEEDKGWADFVRDKCPSNANVRYVPDAVSYVSEIDRFEEDFDVIVIDGGHSRYQCAQTAINRVKTGGMIILDNSDHYFRTAKALRDANFIQIDMTGFGPIQGNTWTTSLFLHRAFDIEPIDDLQPKPGVGSVIPSEEERILREGIASA